jgi:hypothetical protein
MTHVEKLHQTARRIRGLARDCDSEIYAEKLAQTARELEDHAAELARSNALGVAYL